jgi:hypothetical protein
MVDDKTKILKWHHSGSYGSYLAGRYGTFHGNIM